MTDTTVNPLPLVGTAVVSASGGDQIGNALADIVSWLLQLACHCTPPTSVLSAVHTISVAAIVFGACLIHIKLFKTPT